MNLSKKIELIIAIFEQCQSDYLWYREQLTNAENEETDLSHAMIGIGSERKPMPKYKERASLATKWQKVLLKRRMAKDYLALYQALHEFVSSDIGKGALNHLRQVLGKTRKYENYIATRSYTNRSVKSDLDNPVLNNSLNERILELLKEIDR